MSDFFDIKFNDLIHERIPIRLRQSRLMAFLSAISAELNRLFQLFRTNRQSNLAKLGITPQVCYLEKLLNDRYDFTQRRIYITDGSYHPAVYIYQPEEQKPLYIYVRSENKPVYIYAKSENINVSDDFIVWVPRDISFELAEMTILVRIYKLAGTQFKIQKF